MPTSTPSPAGDSGTPPGARLAAAALCAALYLVLQLAGLVVALRLLGNPWLGTG